MVKQVRLAARRVEVRAIHAFMPGDKREWVSTTCFAD